MSDAGWLIFAVWKLSSTGINSLPVTAMRLIIIPIPITRNEISVVDTKGQFSTFSQAVVCKHSSGNSSNAITALTMYNV